MKRTTFWFEPKRLGCTVTIWAMLAHAGSAFAVSPGYAGFVAQIPTIYASPPDVNVMFTLDDSGSMEGETIPDDNNGVGESMWTGTWASSTALNKFRISSQVWRYYRSSAGNPIYYDPAVRYTPWPFAGNDALTYPNASPTAVCYQQASLPVPTTLPLSTTPPTQAALVAACPVASRRNVAARVVVNAPDNTNQNDETRGYWPATYFVRTTTAPALAQNGQANNATTNPNNATGQSYWQKVEIRPTLPGSATVATYPKAAARTDCSGAVGAGGCNYTEEIQNFANWFQYYRTRALMAKGAVAQAFARQGTNLRAGYATLHGAATNIDGGSTPLIKLGVRKFETTARQAFYARVYGTYTTSGTPLRYAADTVGRYFSRSGPGNPWSENPANTSSVGTEYSCRKSFHILTSDGYWNDISQPTLTGVGNADNFTNYVAPGRGSAATGSTFNDANTEGLTVNPFIDQASNTLSDYVAHYWKRDLRPNIDNNVPSSTRDPAYWQHLTTYAVGIGVTNANPAITTQSQRDALIQNRTAVTWPTSVTASSGDGPKGDDFVHASMSGRGRFFLALNPTEFANDLANALTEVAALPLDQASVAADAPQVRAGGRIYQATFNPSRWSGRLYAFNQNTTTGVAINRPTDSSFTNPSQAWEASHRMPAPAARNIFTSTGGTGTGSTFTWAGLTAAQRGYLNNDSGLLDYLRGSPTQEIANGGSRRDRSRYTIGAVTGGVLGDVVNGSPIKGPDFGGGYDRLPGADPASSSYATFRLDSTLDNLRNSIFLGANDGMLHAFNLTDGVERFAYVPNAVYNVPRSTSGGLAENKLALLAEPTYTHRFTVDGPPNIGDAYLSGAWRSVLIASNGAGARGIYAMDVTNPAVGGTGGFGTGRIMWEFTEANNSDVGFVAAYPHIVRMRDGSWAAIFGNGADSFNGRAKLFILNLATGAVIREFAVDTGTPGNNGLSQPNFILNASREVTTIYAGDLKGNMWKFNVDDVNPANWNVAFGSTPLFSAISGSGVAQPISVMPEITAHPLGGASLTFGTGKFFEGSDTASTNPPNVNLSTQTIYGIWDRPAETTGIAMTVGNRSSVLVPQTAPTITPPTGSSASTFYGASTTNTPNWVTQRGWYMDLGSGGERVNLPAQQVQSVMFVIANTPVSDPCANGGSSKVFAVNPLTGANLPFAVFDVNGNGSFEDAEIGQNVRLNQTGVLTQPIFQLPTQASYNAPLIGVSPFAIFDRGQASSARGGGVELTRSSGGTIDVPNPCSLLMTAAQSDTTLMSQYIQTCQPPAAPAGNRRISWRQLK